MLTQPSSLRTPEPSRHFGSRHVDAASLSRSSSNRPARATLAVPAVDLKSRWWAYLFENLNRAVDELYTTCEVDESAVECEEVIMMLRAAANDFTALIQRYSNPPVQCTLTPLSNVL